MEDMSQCHFFKKKKRDKEVKRDKKEVTEKVGIGGLYRDRMSSIAIGAGPPPPLRLL